MKFAASFAFAAVATVAAQPEISSDNGNLEATLPVDGDLNVYRRQTISVGDLATTVAALQSTVTEMGANSAAYAGSQEIISGMMSQTIAFANQQGDLTRQVDAMSRAVDAANSRALAADGRVTAAEARLSASVSTSLAASEARVESTLDTLSDELTEQVNTDIAAINTSLTRSVGGMHTTITQLAQSTGAITDRLRNTALGDSSIPVFKWQKWHTHHHGISWIDENRPQGFGGIHPSWWTDSNRRADQMNADWKYINRLFIRKGYASQYGATICSDVYSQYSSTTGEVCGAVFRIKNTGTNTIRWAPDMLMTSYSGWSERASISVNGANNIGGRNCQHECRFSPGLNIPANSTRNRVSTVIFISTSSYPHHSWSWWERASILMFMDNALRLPNGLEYVDDFEQQTGSWKR